MKHEAGVRDRGRGIADTVMAGFISMGAEHDRCLRSCRPWGMALVLLVVAACGGGGGGSGSSNDTDDTATVESVSLDRETLLLETGDSASITATLHLSNGGTASRSSNVNWFLGNGGVAEIEGGDGTVVDVEAGPSDGHTTITAESGGHSATADIYVSENVALQVRPSAVHLPPKCSAQVTARLITDEGVTQDVTRDVNWYVSNSDLFTVKGGTADEGLLRSLDNGGVSILAAVYRDKRATSRVIVTELGSLELFDAHKDENVTGKTISLAQDEPRRLNAKGVFPSDIKRTINCVGWSSGKTSVATVNSDGIVNGVSRGGPVSVEAVADYDEDIFGEVDVNVTDNQMTGVSIDRGNISIKEGQIDHLTANADFDDDSLSQDITAVVDWSSDSPGIASVGNETDTKGRIRGVTVGTTTARAILTGIPRSPSE